MSQEGAPGELELVRNFVNTKDVEGGADELDTPDGLRRWFVATGLIDPGEAVTPADVARAVEVREGLRSILLSHHGGDLTPDALSRLDSAARAAPLAVRFRPDGGAELQPAGPGVEAAIGRIFAIVLRATTDGTWQRLKACKRQTCVWAFYDHSRNRSRNWCSMNVCGNRQKAEQYRRRQKEERA